jgi:hypothetical protein
MFVWHSLCRSRPLQDCANTLDVPQEKANAAMKYNQTKFMTFFQLASKCGLPANTVKLTPPLVTTCEGADVQFKNVTDLYVCKTHVVCRALTRVCA